MMSSYPPSDENKSTKEALLRAINSFTCAYYSIDLYCSDHSALEEGSSIPEQAKQLVPLIAAGILLKSERMLGVSEGGTLSVEATAYLVKQSIDIIRDYTNRSTHNNVRKRENEGKFECRIGKTTISGKGAAFIIVVVICAIAYILHLLVLNPEATTKIIDTMLKFRPHS